MSMIFDENKENLPLESGSTPKKQTKSRSSKATTLLGESQQSNTKEVTFEQIPDQACRTANRNSWDPIATLDEEENWTERTHFITQEDHLIYKEVAQNILEELISKATNTACVNNNQIEKMFHDEDDDFSNMPVKPRGKPMNVSANIPDDDIPFDDMPVVRRGGGGPVIPTEDPFDNIKITRGDGGGEGAVKIPDEDPFDSVKIPASASLEEESTLNNSDDFYSVPVKRRGATPVVVPEDDSTTNNDLLKENGEDILRHTGTEMPIKARGGKPVVVPEDHADDDFDNLPVKVRSPQPVMVPDEETLLHDDGTGETKKPKAKGVTFDLNLNNTEEMTQETIVKSTSLNDSDSGVGSQNSSAVGISSQDFGDEFDGEFQTTSSDFMNELSFLENCGENDTEAALRQAELARKSLYVRFDPLVSDSPLGNANSLQSQMNNLNFDDLEQAKMAKDEEAPRQLSANQSYAEISGDPFSPAKKSQNQLPKVEDELPIIDIAKVSGVQNKGLVEPLLYTQSDLDEVVRARENEWSKRYSDLEAKIKEEIAMRELLEQDHREKMECLRKENIDMKQVVTQYEKTIVELTENSHSNHMFNEETLSETVRAKEQLQQDLHSAETNLVDAYKRIEKLKMAIDTYKSNEDDLKASVNEFQIKLKRSEERYQKLKQHAAEKVESANIEINKVRKQKEIDLAGLQAGLKKAQSRINSLEQEVQQKARENADYAQICDDLIKKVSGE